MPIPQSQLDTWSRQGSITQSAETYRTIKRALESDNATYTSRNFKVFLQGSYGNDSNIFSESDVDVVIRYDGAFYHDLTAVPQEEQSLFNSSYSDGTYPYNAFKGHAQAALETAFGNSVNPGKQAIKIEAKGSRRNVDVVVAFEFRRYHKFKGISDNQFDRGISFFNQEGVRISNYPKQHSDNCTSKHQATNNNFKPTVRIFKNLRSKLVNDGLIDSGVAPSYYIEGLLYNVPNDRFSGSSNEVVFKALKWLQETTDRTKFVCANEQYYLLRDDSHVCWPLANGDRFIDAAIKLWNNW